MCPINSANSLNDLDLVVVPVISLNPKKAKKKLKKAARAEDSVGLDTRLPVDQFDVESIEVVPAVSLNHKKASAKTLKASPQADGSKVEKSFMPPTPATSAESTPMFKLDELKKSWYDITMDDDDDFCGALSNC